MRLLTVGFGQAGGRVVDELLAREPREGGVVEHAVAINTAKADLLELEHVPESNRVLVGQKRVKGHGVGADNELGAEIAEEDLDEIQAALDEARIRDVDAFLIVAGLGGGTGSGGAPVLAKHLRRIYTEPVFGLGILPATDEGGIYTLNAARSLPPFRDETDGLLLFDNDAWQERGGDPDYDRINRAFVARLRGVLAAPADAGILDGLAEGDGFGTIGYAAEEVETGGDGLLSRFTGSGPEVDEADAVDRLTEVTRKAALGRLTMPADLSDCAHAGLVCTGPEPHLSRRGFEQSRRWLADQVGGETAGHMAPEDAGYVACTVLLTGFEWTPRLEELEQVAEEAGAEIQSLRAETQENVERLAEDDDEDLDPLFGGDDGTSTAGDTPTADDSSAAEDTSPEEGGAPERPEVAGGGSGDSSPSRTSADSTTSGEQAVPSDERTTDEGPVTPGEGGTTTDDERVPTTNEPTTIPGAPDLRLDYDDIRKEEPIGRGGNADVFRATVPGPDGEVVVALKEPRLGGTLHREAAERLLEEAEIWSKLDDHDHVVGVVDYGAEPLPWIAMEFMDGGHLGERADGMSFAQQLWTAIAVTRAVRDANRRGVAHLDLKPENVLLRSVEGAWDVPKVADWGLSKHLLEQSGSLDGLSPTYAAPEQFDGDRGPTDNVTDVYQLGAVFYELFTGQPPFEGSPMEVMQQVAAEEPAPPSEVADVPQALDGILGRALATDRAARYEDALQLRNELEALYASL